MKIKETIGIDISKLSFDVRIHSNQDYCVFENNVKGFKKLTKWVFKSSPFSKEEILFVFEHTGLYSFGLSVFLSEQHIPFVLIPGLEIKRSLGITRGKNDKVDATKIALYAYRLRENIKPTILASKELIALKRLLSLRGRLVMQRAGFKGTLKEQKGVLDKRDNKILFQIQEKIIKQLSKEISTIENSIEIIIKNSEQLNQIFKLVISVKGVGTQTALLLIVYTNAFTKFKNARNFASYCGIAPFPYSSGTSVKGRTKVSHLANKKVKSLLNLCAISAIQSNKEMKTYYDKRVLEGKNKMSTINIIRNKLLSRVFAVVNRQTPYVDFMKYAA